MTGQDVAVNVSVVALREVIRMSEFEKQHELIVITGVLFVINVLKASKILLIGALLLTASMIATGSVAPFVKSKVLMYESFVFGVRFL